MYINKKRQINTSIQDEQVVYQRIAYLKEEIKILRSKNDNQAAINALFSIYSTVLSEKDWVKRDEWKNDLLNEIQSLIQDLSKNT